MKKLFITSLIAWGIGTANAQVNLNSGLTHHFKFDGENHLLNAVPGAPNLTQAGSGVATAVADRFGNPNAARKFVGSPAGADAYKINNPNLPTGNAPRSVSVWVKMPNANSTDHGAIFSWGSSPNSPQNRYYSLTHEQGRKLNNWAYGNDLLSPTAIEDTNWINIVLTHDGDTNRMYVNANLVAKAAKNYNTVSDILYVGGKFGNIGQSTVNLEIDDMRIYNRALSTEEISSLYNAPQAASYLHFKFDGSLKEEFSGLNASMVGSNINIVPSPTYVADQNGVPNQAIRFNGSTAVLFNQPALVNPNTKNASFTAWVKKDVAVQQAYVFGVRNSGSPNYNQFALYAASIPGNNSGSVQNGIAFSAFSIQNSLNCLLSTQAPVADINWVHIAVVQKSVNVFNPPLAQRRDSLFLYINGTLKNTAIINGCSANESLTTNAPFTVGARFAGNNSGNNLYDFYFRGSVADVKYFRSALTPAQISADYEGSLVVTDLPAAKREVKAIAQIFPNPTNGQFTVKGIAPNSTITVLDMQGRMVKQLVANDEAVIHLSNSPAGIYLVRIMTDNQLQTIKLVKK